MNAVANIILQNLVDHAVACHPAQTGKSVSYDQHAKMTFAGAGRAAMTGMKIGLVDDLEPCRPQRDNQFFAHPLFGGRYAR